MLGHWVNSSWDNLTLTIKTLWSCKTLGAIYPVTQYNIPPGLNLHNWITSFLQNLQWKWKRIHSAHFDKIQLILNAPQFFRWVTHTGFSIRDVLKVIVYYNVNARLTIMAHYMGNEMRHHPYFTNDYDNWNQQIRLSPQQCHLLESTLFAESDAVCK